jgi:hypothetical protein
VLYICTLWIWCIDAGYLVDARGGHSSTVPCLSREEQARSVVRTPSTVPGRPNPGARSTWPNSSLLTQPFVPSLTQRFWGRAGRERHGDGNWVGAPRDRELLDRDDRDEIGRVGMRGM